MQQGKDDGFPVFYGDITDPSLLVGHANSSVTLRVNVPVRIKARFAGNGRSLAKKRNTESHRQIGSRWAAAQAPWAAFRSLELTYGQSCARAPCPRRLCEG